MSRIDDLKERVINGGEISFEEVLKLAESDDCKLS